MAKTTKKETSKEILSDIMSAESLFSEERVTVNFNNYALQKITGGVHKGEIVEISGHSQSGKSYLQYELVASVLKEGGYALICDLERAMSKGNLINLGVTVDQIKAGLSLSYQNRIEDLFSDIQTWIKEKRKKNKNAKIIVCLDSFAALQTRDIQDAFEKGEDLEGGYIAMRKNAAFSQAITKLSQVIDDTGAIFVILNQVRKDYKILFGDNTVSPAEDIIKFWCHLRIRGKLIGSHKKKVESVEKKTGVEIKIGARVSWETIKNRNVKPFQKAFVDIFYAKGINPYSGLTEVLLNDGTISKVKGSDEQFKLTKPLNDKESAYVFSDSRLLMKKFPRVLEPIWTGTYDDGEDYSFEPMKEETDEDEIVEKVKPAKKAKEKKKKKQSEDFELADE